MRPFRLSKRSEARLQGVDPFLRAVVREAIKVTAVDFAVVEGLRTEKRQAELVRIGASQTMDSRHLTGDAVDLAPYHAGSIRWDWPLFYPLAEAVARAAWSLTMNPYNQETGRWSGYRIRWGGDWNRLWSETDCEPPTARVLEDRVAAYVHERQRQGRKAFTDGPHFEVVRL